MLTGTQIREARELLGWSLADLARNAFLPLAVVASVEEHNSTLMLPRHTAIVAHTLQKAGVTFPGTKPQMRDAP